MAFKKKHTKATKEKISKSRKKETKSKFSKLLNTIDSFVIVGYSKK